MIQEQQSINIDGGYCIQLDQNTKGQPVARLRKLITVGKNKGQYKQLEGFYFQTEERRSQWIKEKIEQLEQRKQEKQQQAATKKQIRENMNHSFEVGQIYYDSWGYDQTNIDFYQIIEVKNKSVVIRRIEGEQVPNTEGFMSAMVRPVKDHFIGEPELKPILFMMNNDQPSFYIKSKWGWISRYRNGEKGCYTSWYA